LVLSTGLPSQYQAALRLQKQRPGPLWEVEKDILGASHAEVGAYLLALWNLPDPLVEALAWHHLPAESLHAEISPLLIVHVADVLEQEGRTGKDFMPQLDEKYLREVGVWSRLPEWRSAVEDEMSGE
jgi:HD-like signal output (HDOD) protein